MKKRVKGLNYKEFKFKEDIGDIGELNRDELNQSLIYSMYFFIFTYIFIFYVFHTYSFVLTFK